SVLLARAAVAIEDLRRLAGAAKGPDRERAAHPLAERARGGEGAAGRRPERALSLEQRDAPILRDDDARSVGERRVEAFGRGLTGRREEQERADGEDARHAAQHRRSGRVRQAARREGVVPLPMPLPNGRSVIEERAMRIHHVQLMMPRGREDEALRFYVELLGLPRIPK